jgi:hypothetical protein
MTCASPSARPLVGAVRRIRHGAAGCTADCSSECVGLALRRPYKFVAIAMLIALMGVVTLKRISTDIFPDINIPIVAAVWTYPRGTTR